MMKNVSYIDDPIKSSKEASSTSGDKIDVTELMNLIDKSKDAKTLTTPKKTPHINFNLIVSKEISNDDTAKSEDNQKDKNNTEKSISLTKSTLSAKRYITTIFITTIAIASFVGMLYFIDQKTEQWTGKQQPPAEQPKAKTTKNINEQDLLRIISSE